MRWGLLCIVFLVFCTQAVIEAPKDTGFTMYHSEISQPAADLYVPQQVQEPSPNYTQSRALGDDLSCVRFGCDDDTQLLGDPRTRTFMSCDCIAAKDIPFKEIKCLRNFQQAVDLDYERDVKCA